LFADPAATERLYRRHSIASVGKILSLVLPYEIHGIHRRLTGSLWDQPG